MLFVVGSSNEAPELISSANMATPQFSSQTQSLTLVQYPPQSLSSSTPPNARTCRILRIDKEDVVSVDRAKAAVAEEPSDLSQGQNAARVIPLTLATWNIRSLLDNPRCNRPGRRTALVGQELACHKEEIAAFSKTRFFEQGQQKEVGAGYTFFWSGRPMAKRQGVGVTFPIRKDIVGRLRSLLQGTNNRLMCLRLPL
ncbi:hypothetical protein SprV_0301251300 [Sparganum proliferum]